jgi:hypothetical protein
MTEEERNKRNDKFWVVTRPSKGWDIDFLSNYITLEDICFLTCCTGLMTQALGGLLPAEVLGVFTDKKPAMVYAKQVLKQEVSERILEQRRPKS